MDNYADILKGGGVGVMPTDTLYGIVGSALNPATVEKIYSLKGRDTEKPFIILISSISNLSSFGVSVDGFLLSTLSKLWPSKVSVILDCPGEKFSYLHRGNYTLAFRLPDKKDLLDLLKVSGPLVAPSANLQGYPPAQTVSQARKYFADRVDFYIDGGKLISLPSTIVKIQGGKTEIVRKGEVQC